MELIDKALELCAEIEQRQAQLRAILARLAEVQPEEVPAQTPESDPSNLSDQPDQSDQSDLSEEPDHSEKPVTTDLRKAFTINDRFRFRRELFGGDDKAFIEAIDRMSACKDYNEIEAFISTLGWDVTNDDVVAFKEIISTFYNGYHL